MRLSDYTRGTNGCRFLRLESAFHGCRLTCLAVRGLANIARSLSLLTTFCVCIALAQTKETISNYENIQIHPSNLNQSEMSIALDPLDRLRLLVGCNTDSGLGSYRTADGGIGWLGNDNLTVGFADPTVAFDTSGTRYFCHISSIPWQGDFKRVISVSRSTDAGVTWDSVVHLPDPDPPLYTSKKDKPHLAIDTSSASPYGSRMYAGYTDIANNHLYFSRCSTHSAGFTALEDWTAGSTSAFDFGMNIATAPNGNVYACWASIDVSLPDAYAFNAISFRRSTTGGASFDGAIRITGTTMRGLGKKVPHLLKTLDHRIRMWTLPSMAVDASGGMFHGWIYVAWVDTTYGDPDILLKRSRDEGVTWDPVVRVNDDPVGNDRDQWEPWLTVDPKGGVHVVFYDSRDDSANLLTAVYMASSADGGSTFTNQVVSDLAFTPVPVEGAAAHYMGDYNGITSDSQFAYPCWNDNRTGIHQAYVAKIPTNRAATVPQLSGHITSNTTWDWMVDLVGDVTVDSGVTLTINPRARITPNANSDNEHGGADSNLTELIVKGTLAFEADTLSPARRPVFKSSTGEDSSWYGIRMMAGSSLTGTTRFRMYDAVNDLSLDGYATIPAGDTLLVNPDLAVTATSSGAAIVVYGTLQFETDPNNPSARALLHSASGVRGSWLGIWVYSGGRIESGPGFVITDAVNGVFLLSGASGEVRGVRVDNAENAGFWCGSSSVSFDHDTVTGISAGYGMYLEDCDPTISALRIQGCEYGVLAYGSSGSVTGSLIEGPGAYGVYVLSIPEFLGADTLRLVDDSVAGSFSGAHLYAGGSGHCSIDSCSFVSTPGSGQSLYGIKAYNGAWVKLRHSKIIDYGLRGFYSYRSWAHLGGKLDPGHNEIYTSAPCEECFVKSVYHSGVDSWDTLKAESNWWNSNPPPAAWFTSLVDYTPWLTSPPLGKLAPPVAEEPVTPRAMSLLDQNYPNPFNPTTTIVFALPASSHADLRIYNILAQLVRVLLDQDLPAGSHQVAWDGTDGRGRSVATGVYFYRLVTAGHTESRKMVVLK